MNECNIQPIGSDNNLFSNICKQLLIHKKISEYQF